MSLKPVHTTQPPFLYAAGNTPAVSLTQSLPPEQDAALLLLGCGDIRNILSSVYNGAGTNGRKLDFTCCDLETEIIARNVLALSTILDDAKGTCVRLLWNLYYHVFIDNETLTLLQGQAKKLLNHAESLEEWEQGPYGNLVRFCDNTTFANVVKLWELYSVEPSDQSRYKEVQETVRRQWDAARRYKNMMVSNDGIVVDGLRAAAPFFIEGYADVPRQYQTFWDSGTCFEDKKAIKKLTFANPMFACRRSGLILHYANNPLWGFHLSLIHVPLSADSPLGVSKAVPASEKSMPKELRAALVQLGAWCQAFRDADGQVTVRYVSSDAIAFCHVLQHHRTNNGSHKANWYRGTWNYNPLVLDSSDYADSGHAPLSFDVIDTSNLVDHLGSLNLITATAPLLRELPSSTLRTEMLLPREISVAESAKTLLSGDLPTMALLLGLKPIQYLANATATWHVNEPTLEDIPGAKDIAGILARNIVVWKPAEIGKVKYEATELAKFVGNLYMEMFPDEDLTRKLQKFQIGNEDERLKKLQFWEVYTKAGLAVVLRHLKNTDIVEWLPFMDDLADNILADEKVNMSPYQFHSLFAHLDMFGLYSIEEDCTFQQDLHTNIFLTWSQMPPIVCVTMVVPHSAVAAFDDLNDYNGTPLCQLQLSSSPHSKKKSIYPDVQLGFGKLTTSGTPLTNSYRVYVEDDQAGCNGKSPLIVSAMVSRYSLIQYGGTECGVMFGLKGTTANAAHFSPSLGEHLHLHTSAVNRKNVFVTRYRPNMTGHASVQCAAPSAKTHDEDVAITVRPCFDDTSSRIISLHTRLDIISVDVKTALQSAAAVEVELSNPYSLIIKVGSAFRKVLELPLPLDGARGKTKVARKSLWIEYSAPVAQPSLLASRPDSVFSIQMTPSSKPLLDHLHYVLPDVLPKMNNAKANINTDSLSALVSTRATMSATEHAAFKKAISTTDLHKGGRLGMKETIVSMFIMALGLQKQEKTSVFGLKGSHGDFATIFVDAVRIDVSNQTIILDAACVALHDEISDKFSTTLSDIMSDVDNVRGVFITPDAKEVPFWKHLLPTFAERCRQWKHKSTCEYKPEGRIPLSTDAGKRYMCRCGIDIFPAGYMKELKQFSRISKHAVRVAIPLIFASPISPEDATASPRPAQSHQPAAPAPAGQQNGSAASLMDEDDAKILQCIACDATRAKDGGELKKCSRCKLTRYCSAECQAWDWKNGHKVSCKFLKEHREFFQ
ncbi:uncharacterized protein K460DRAFT_386537 [Cucurbitaria berberidis CBS 394.84]|uniref:MYND-type domain-containing protein n=1 Tax=Cucurbitaria berberidis CBS 394.84 TaxID=1168544 RepID=A0A9P4L8N1_9PLEO|nr:uncharacterized protein K460DRAFT_386537 [Cucurbitaria berberidis CBS 394.84]KAF1846230.1 hypothetical protein K460DRAFT_386537 [Cucurbitaria berberidis CBS 394.84]